MNLWTHFEERLQNESVLNDHNCKVMELHVCSAAINRVTKFLSDC